MRNPSQYLIKKINKLYKAPRRRAALRAFDSIEVGSGDIAVDCGANIGDITARLAAGGGRVTAFEPNADAFGVLSARFKDSGGVECVHAAVADHAGIARLYLNRRYDRDPVEHSGGSSLLPTKRNLDVSRYVDVETVDLAAFIFGLERRVHVLKLDIEGAEFRVMNHLIDTGAIFLIDHVFCETHEYKAPGLAAERRALVLRLQRANIMHVNLDWY